MAKADGGRSGSNLEDLYSATRLLKGARRPPAPPAEIPPASTAPMPEPIMRRTGQAEFLFEGDPFRAVCRELTGAQPEEVLVNPQRISTLTAMLDRRIRSGASPAWERFAASFPDLAPEAVRVSLELSGWWPSQAAAAASRFAVHAHPGCASLEAFAQELAAVLGRAAVHGKELAEIYDIVTDIGRRARRRELPWHILAPVRLMQWPDVVVGYQGRAGKVAVFGGQSSPFVVSVTDRIAPEDVQSTAAAMALITKLRSLIRETQSTASDLYLEADRSGNVGLRDFGQDLIDPVRDLRETIETTYDACVEFTAKRPPKAAHQHDLYARIADEFATTIAKLTERAYRAREKRRALFTARPGAAGSAGGVYGKVPFEGARRLMKALYGVDLPAGFLRRRVQNRVEARLAPRKPPKK